MISKATLQMLELESIEDYFEYIIQSKVNGQHSQAKELFKELSDSPQGQRSKFFNWAEENYYYDAQDSDEMDELLTLKKYFYGL